MTENYWAHTHATGKGAPGGCDGSGLGKLWPAMSNTSGHSLGHSLDNGTYESTLFGDHAVGLIESHASRAAIRGLSPDAMPPLFIYLAFHNEHDPHQAPKAAVEDEATAGRVKSDTYKVTVAQIATMDFQVGRVMDAYNRTGMLPRLLVSFTSDNGGPLDHANNWPRRGGKHGFYEGGVRTEAFVWAGRATGLMPESIRGSTYKGLMHIADWRATLTVGVVGLDPIVLDDGGAFANESMNHWPAVMGGGTVAAPRTELLHSVHSPTWYPGNCSIHSWRGRNCPAVITSGDLKYMIGYVGDPRRINIDDEVISGPPLPFGRSGGKCGIDGGASEGTRCDAPGKHGGPKPKPDDPGGCLHGCLFNVTDDAGESRNLIHDSAYAGDMARMVERLKEAGEVAPPWFQAPEVAHLSHSALGSALCDAAHRAGSVQPTDF